MAYVSPWRCLYTHIMTTFTCWRDHHLVSIPNHAWLLDVRTPNRVRGTETKLRKYMLVLDIESRDGGENKMAMKVPGKGNRGPPIPPRLSSYPDINILIKSPFDSKSGRYNFQSDNGGGNNTANASTGRPITWRTWRRKSVKNVTGKISHFLD
jgi:hypothetical protein